jgi:peptidoglycan/xylan/chitin deacetylase (PgdA/CDA1 family)
MKEHRAGYCEITRFRAQLAWLKWTGYRVISLRQAYDALFHGLPLQTHSVVLTFDDGYQNFADQALPVLTDYGYPSVVFAVSGLLGRKAEWLPADRAADLMSGSTLRDLTNQGVEIGSHTVHHHRLSRITPDQQKLELTTSKQVLEDVLGQSVDFLAYPYGDYDTGVRDATASAGYRAAVTCSRGSANTAPNAFEIPRKAISYGDSLAGFAWKLALKNRRKDRYA